MSTQSTQSNELSPVSASAGAPPHPEERARIRSLHNLKILDTEPGASLQRLTDLVAAVLGMDMAAISLVDVDRQWYLTRFGLSPQQTGREESFCAHAIHAESGFVVEDALLHPDFKDNPLVTGEPHIRSYAGTVLRDTSGLPLGTLCVLGKAPRQFSQADLDTLHEFGRTAREELLELSQRNCNENNLRRDTVTGALRADSFLRSARRLSMSLGDRHGASIITSITFDNLSFLSDTHGGQATDQILRGVCEVVQQHLEAHGMTLVGRPDGKRLLTKTIRSAPVDKAYLDRVRVGLVQALSLGIDCERGRVQPHLSIAVTQRTSETELVDAISMCRIATERLTDKSHDVRSVLVDKAIEEEARYRVQVESDLSGAIAADQLHIVLQPKFDIYSDRLVGFESLLRWEHPTLQAIGALDIVQAARNTHRITDMDRWVIRTVCQSAKAWLDGGLDFGRISINLSGETLLDPKFFEWFKSELHSTGIPAWVIDFEIVESAFFSSVDGAIAAMDALTALGVSFSLDDFGTGYSSLNYLRRLPISSLKIDKSFVDAIDHEPNAAAMCGGIISMAHELGLSVIAEGVETDLQRVALRALRCDQAQGFLYARPMPLDQAEALLVEQVRKSGTSERDHPVTPA